jgi:O-antigen/teichoic acid export membrane protein
MRVNRSTIILRNIASNWVGFAINAAVTLVLTPFILREIGVARYGVWILTSSIIGYYGFLDLGFRAGVTQYLTRYLAIRDYGKGSECVSSAVMILSALGALMVVLSIGAAYIAPHLFSFPLGMEREAFWCILIVGFTTAAQFALNPFSSLFTATQRFDLANLIGVGTRLLSAAGIFTALRMGYGLIGLSAAFCGVTLIDYLIRWRVALHLVPELKVSRRLFKLDRLREIGSFGGWNFLISVNAYVYGYVPNILIGAFMPVAAVGHYALAMGLSRQVNSVLSPVGQVVYPAAAELHVQGNQSGLERLYHDGSRLMMLAMIPIVLVAAFWAEDFYRLWIGEKYLSGAPFHSVALVFRILLISTVTNYSFNIASQILMGSGRVRVLAVALIFGSVLNVAFSVLLIGPYGLVGVATAVAIASVAVDLIAMPLMAQRVLGLSVTDLIRSACMRPLAAGALQSILMLCIRFTGQPKDWTHLILQGAVAGTGSAALALFVGITARERQRFIVQPLQSLWKKGKVAEAVGS